MDFNLTEDQRAVYELADQIFTGHLTPERFKALTGGFDRDLWSALASAGLIGISLPEAAGGSDQGFLALALLAEQVGRHAAPVPVVPVAVAALAGAKFGGAEIPGGPDWLAGVSAGERIVVPALSEPGTDPTEPATTARSVDGGWRLDGAKSVVWWGAVADAYLVPAVTGGGVGVFTVQAADCTVTPLITTSGSPAARIDLHDAPGELLGSETDGVEIVEWMVMHLTAALSSQMAGAAKRAVELTSEYTKGREQFERPIATFQAVAQRAADAFIDAEGIQLTSRQAAWRLSEGLRAVEQVAIAKFWAAEAGQRVVHAAAHLHGGVGVDRDYPLHRYFLMAKEIELALGGATVSLLRLGRVLADEPAAL